MPAAHHNGDATTALPAATRRRAAEQDAANHVAESLDLKPNHTPTTAPPRTPAAHHTTARRAPQSPTAALEDLRNSTCSRSPQAATPDCSSSPPAATPIAVARRRPQCPIRVPRRLPPSMKFEDRTHAPTDYDGGLGRSPLPHDRKEINR